MKWQSLELSFGSAIGGRSRKVERCLDDSSCSLDNEVIFRKFLVALSANRYLFSLLRPFQSIPKS